MRDVSWHVRPGTKVIVLGPNGAGKTTLLGVLAGSLTPTSGEVMFDDTAVSRDVLARAVSRMPQTVTAVPRLKCEEQVAYAGWLGGLSEREARQRSVGALERVGLAERHRDRADALSGGQLRRLGLAEALVRHTPYILLDEPTAGLDPQERARFRAILGAIQDVAFVVSTHETHDISDVFARVCVLRDGAVTFDGTITDLLARTSSATVEEAYIALMGSEAA